MKLKNPFRTKLLVFAHVDYTLIIRVPFFGKATIRKEKVDQIKGYTVNLIIMDDTGNLK